MCGVVVATTFRSGNLDLGDLADATNRLRHRGPDDEGYLLADLQERRAFAAAGEDTVRSLALPHISTFRTRRVDAALGFRRLSIIDLSDNGHQPFGSEDGSQWLAFNGEIYNFIELRSELQKEGISFQSGSDTEVLLAALSQWGLSCLDRLIGMWAFALLDLRKRSMLVCRDPFGIKPLFWTIHRGVFWAASEIKALVGLPGFSARADPSALNDYLRHGLSEKDGRTLWSGIHALPTGTWMEVLQDSPVNSVPQPVRYCDLQAPIEDGLWAGRDVRTAASELRREFIRNVEIHLRSDVGYGCLLSGGIDSSSIVSVAAHLRGGTANFDTFTYASGDASDESALAARVAADVGCRNHRLSLKGSEVADCLERATLAHDEPISGPSVLAQYKLFELVRSSGTKVVLDGQGADELLGGYAWYLGARVASSLRGGHLGSAASLVRGWLSQGGGSIALSGIARYTLPPRFHWPIRRALGMDGIERWMNLSWFRERSVAEEIEWDSPHGDPLTSVRQMEIGTNLVDLLRFEDRNSMAHSVESRVPFLTLPFARLALSMPSDFLISSAGDYKHVFKLSMDGLVPHYVLRRKDKIGFNAPEAQLLVENRSYFLEQTRNGNKMFEGPLNRQSLTQSIQTVQGSGDVRILWRTLATIEWARCHDVALS